MNLALKSLVVVCCFLAGPFSQAKMIDQDGILRDDNSQVLYIGQQESLTACPDGTHLATIRELAQKSQSLGAKGILEKNQVKPGEKPPPDFNEIPAVHIDPVTNVGTEDKFYFSRIGYQRPSGGLGAYYFWSSSALQSVGSWYRFLFNGASGDVYWLGELGQKWPVICLK